jgi:TRAP-type C4-dicarboxylate transport system substrate-binding protein
MKTRFLIAAALAGTALGAQAQTTLTVSSWLPPSHLLSQTQAAWCDEVAKATSNRVKCNILPKPVTAPPGTFDAVRDGLADVSYSVHGYTPGRYLLTSMVEMPFMGDSAEAMSVAYQRVHEKYLSKLDEHRGLKVITVFTHGPGHIYNTKHKIDSVADFAGLKFRIGGGVIIEITKALDMNATLKPASAAYELLSSGVMDGVLFPSESIESFKLEKIVRYQTILPGGLYNTSFAMVMNPATWNKLPKQDQDAITKLSGEHAARMFGRAWDKNDVRGQAFMQAAGVQSIKASKAFIDDVAARTAGVVKKWIAEAKAKGLANAEAIVREYRAEVKKLQ